MAQNKTAQTKTAQTETKRTDDGKTKFTADERAAMKEYAQELQKTAKRKGKATREDGERDIQEKIAGMPEPDRSTAARVHELVLAAVPELFPTTWYGMPAYSKDGKTICFFQAASKFKARFSTLGFSDKAQLDDGDMWPIYYALNALTPDVERQITELVRKAAG
jgi:uncharacterized protein YdhG (YjbR/CyaY superfamily)